MISFRSTTLNPTESAEDMQKGASSPGEALLAKWDISPEPVNAGDDGRWGEATPKGK